MSQEDATKVKKSVLMRYPLSFLEECSRALIGYRSFRDNKQYYKALPIMSTLIEYVTLDPSSGRSLWDLTEQERKDSPHHFIELPRKLVQDFIRIFDGPRTDGILPLRYLSPGQQVDPMKGVVTIRKPVNFVRAWAGHPPEYIILKGGFYVKVVHYQPTQFGMMPVEEMKPLIPFGDPNLIYDETDTVPFNYWVSLYDKGWLEISPIATMIEKVIAATLENAGYSIESSQPSKEEEQGEKEGIMDKLRDRLGL